MFCKEKIVGIHFNQQLGHWQQSANAEPLMN